MPTPTRSPAARSAASGAIPQPSSAFERGQCATATSCRASRSISSSSTFTQCAATMRSSSSPCSARLRIAALAVRARRASRRTAATAPRRGAASRARRALVQVRRDRQAEASAGGVHLDRAGVRRVRRDAEPHPLRQRRLHVLALLLEPRAAPRRRRGRRPRGRRSRAGRARRRRARSRRQKASRRPS